MNPAVEKYLMDKAFGKKSNIDEDKRRLALELGLFEKTKQRLDYDDPIELYENADCEWDEEEEQYIYYARKPIELTDEEYEALLKADESNRENKENKKNIGGFSSGALQLIAIVIYIAGFIGGIVSGFTVSFDIFSSSTEISFSWGLALSVWLIAFVSGTIILGFAKIIQLLNSIYKEMKDKD